MSSEGFGRVDWSGRVGPVARAVWPRSAVPALLVRLVAVLAAVRVVAARLVVVWLLLVVV